MEASVKTTRILIVGGTGFIGSHLAEAALNEGWEVTSISLNSPSAKRFVAGVTYFSGDLTSRVSIDHILGTPFDYVVNLGGYIEHTHFGKGGRKVIDAHLNGLLNLIEGLSRDKLKHFVQIGSSDEYGTAPAPQSEQLREGPISPYAFAKTAAAHFLQMLYVTEKFPATTVRFFLVYGPGQDEKRFLPQIIKGCLRGETFPVSEGNQLRDFCYVSDAVKAIILLLKSGKLQGDIVNIGSGKPVTIRNVINSICSQIGKGTPKFGELPYRTQENMALVADISKIRSSLGWEPAITLEDGLMKTIEAVKKEYEG